MNSPSVLFEALTQHDSINQTKLRAVFNSLPKNATLDHFRKKLSANNVMSLADIMNIHITTTLLPASKALLEKLENDRKEKAHYKPEVHKQKFHISEEDTMSENVVLSEQELAVVIPKWNVKAMEFSGSDEQQAVTLAIELANMNEVHEAEMILIETLESFTGSQSAMSSLCRLYLCAGHPIEAEVWALTYIETIGANEYIYELLALARQAQNKNILAISVYHKLMQKKKVKKIWYLLLAFSQERSLCHAEAIGNYKIYLTVGKSEALKELCHRHILELRAT